MSDFDRSHRPCTEVENTVKSYMSDIYMPAMPLLGPMLAVSKSWLEAWNRRRQILRLLDYNDHMLHDMGHTRQDLLRAARLWPKGEARQVVL